MIVKYKDVTFYYKDGLTEKEVVELSAKRYLQKAKTAELEKAMKNSICCGIKVPAMHKLKTNGKFDLNLKDKTNQLSDTNTIMNEQYLFMKV